MTRTDELTEILRQLQASAPEIEASALISEDGLMIASTLPPRFDEVAVAGMSATLLSLGQRAAMQLERGGFEQVLVRSAQGNVVLMNAAHGTSLLAMAGRDAEPGRTFLAMTRAAKEIARIL